MTLAELQDMCIDIENEMPYYDTKVPLMMGGNEIGLTLTLKEGYVEVKLQRQQVTPQELKELLNDNKYEKDE